MKGSPWTRLLCAPSVRDQGIEKNPITKFKKKNSLRRRINKGMNGWYEMQVQKMGQSGESAADSRLWISQYGHQWYTWRNILIE